MQIGGNKPILKVDIGDKRFEIRLINVYVLANAPKLFKAISELTEKLDDEDLTKEYLEGLLELRADLIKEILTSNGYEYDPQWWEHKTDYADQNEFVFACYQKDLTGKKKQAGKD
jgi:hypothetical protein